MKMFRLLGAAFCFLCLFHQTGNAALLTVNYTGEVSYVDPTFSAALGINNGDPFSGGFIVDLNEVDQNADTRYGVYSAIEHSYSIAGVDNTNVTPLIVLGNDIRVGPPGSPIVDRITIQGGGGTNTVSGYSFGGVDTEFRDQDLTALSDDSIPLSWNLSDFERAEVRLQMTGALGLTTVFVQITSLESTISNVPLPATLWLFGSGMLGLIGITRRKKSA